MDGPILFEPRVFADDRGFFAETHRAEWLPGTEWVQDNHSRSRAGTVRGMHFQTDPGQAKLVRCARGRIWDVVVDVRAGSPTRGEWRAWELDDEGLHALFIPVGFAHGFAVLSDVADVVYKCSSYYDPETESGFAWDDPDVGIDWPVAEPLVSGRDRAAPRLRELPELRAA